MTTVLIDDARSFRDNRECLVARSSASGLRLLATLRDQRIDELWLDHDLGGDDTIWPVINELVGCESLYNVGVVQVHASRSGAAHEMMTSLRRAGYSVERSVNLRLWKV